MNRTHDIESAEISNWKDDSVQGILPCVSGNSDMLLLFFVLERVELDNSEAVRRSGGRAFVHAHVEDILHNCYVLRMDLVAEDAKEEEE